MKTYVLTKPVDGMATWSDRKRYLWLFGLLVPVLPLMAIGLYEWTGLVAALWLGPFMFHVVAPVAELITADDQSNPPDEVIDELEDDGYYRYVLYAYLPLQLAGFVWGMWMIATSDLGLVGNLGMAFTLGTVAGVAINAAHELGHKREDHERWMARVALAQVFYGHFYVEHNRGHHVAVSTPDDPASSRLGETFYRFWPRTVVGSARSAWRLEAKRLTRKGNRTLGLGNDVVNAWLMTVVLWGALLIWLGLGILPYLILQAIYGFTLLELVNYMEHYGMLRQKVKKGAIERYERVLPEHSWNSNNTATNLLLYHLQRHSDHHAHPTRRYQTLRDFPEAPVLPTGYTGMMALALVPPLFRRVMDPLVVDHYDGDIGRANVQPGVEAKLAKRYGHPGGRPVSVERVDTSGLDTDHHEVDGARCPECGYTYLVAEGNDLEGFPAGTPWASVPDDWCCPDCGVRDKIDFDHLFDLSQTAV